MSTPRSEAVNPETSGARLQEIAAQYPELQAEVAANPSAYPALLDWLKQYGTDEAKSAVDQRFAGSSGSSEPTDQTVLATRHKVAAPPPAKTATSRDATVADPADATVLSARKAAAPAAPTAAFPKAPPPGGVPSRPPVPAQPVPAGPGSRPPLPGQTGVATAAGGSVAPTVGKNKFALLVGGLGTLVVVLAAVLVWLLFFRSDADTTASSPADVAVTVEQSSEPEEEVTLEEEEVEEMVEEEPAEVEEEVVEEKVIRFPAPSNAVTATWFTSESKNVACEMATQGTYCTIYDGDFMPNAGGCSGFPATIVVSERGTQWDCSIPAVSNRSAPILMYSTSSTVGDYSCLATAEAMSCWNHYSGDSFALARGGWVAETNNGVVRPSQMPWL